jgi:hypothetical protein
VFQHLTGNHHIEWFREVHLMSQADHIDFRTWAEIHPGVVAPFEVIPDAPVDVIRTNIEDTLPDEDLGAGLLAEIPPVAVSGVQGYAFAEMAT